MILEHFYLLSGYLQEKKDGKGLEPLPNGLDIVRNTVVFSKAVSSDEKFLPFVTNERGVLYLLGDKFANRMTMQMPDTKLIFQMIPENSLPLLWAAKGEKWAETVNTFFKDHNLNGVELNLTRFFKSHLRPPEQSGSNPDSDEYKKWYSGLSATEPML